MKSSQRIQQRRVPRILRTGLAAASAVVLLVLSAPAGMAQDVNARRLDEVFPPEQAARVREIARESREAGVPPGLIARKAFEGAAKGYSPDRIVTALESYAMRLRSASTILGRDRRPGTLSAAAEALRRGVPPDAIRSLGADWTGRDLAVPLIVLGDLTDAGVPTENALEMVNSAIERGTRGHGMMSLSAAIRRRMRQGDDWRTAVDAVRRRAERDMMRRDRRQPDGAGGQIRRRPSGRTTDAPPVPPGAEAPRRTRDGG
jgi:hypothetical protein